MPRGRKPRPRPEHLRLVEASRSAGSDTPALVEPDWRQTFTVTRGPLAAENQRCRDVARRTWRQVITDLAPVLLPVDRTAIARYAISIARVDQLERQLSREGPTVPGRGNAVVKHPVVAILNAYRADARALGSELGIGPAARLRLPIVPNPPGPDDELWDGDGA